MSSLYPDNPILLVDDEVDFLRMAKLLLKSHGINNVSTCSNTNEASDLIREKKFSLIVLDLIMPGLSGEQLLEKAAACQPNTPVIMVTAVNDTDTVVHCIKNGAIDFITKPIEELRFILTVKNTLLKTFKDQELSRLKDALIKGRVDQPDVFSDIVTDNSKMQAVFQYMEAIAESDQGVLILGETGTGKELFAKAMHKLSKRKGEFIAVNAAGLDDHMFSDTLFGHTKGAFTGAKELRKGLIDKAQEGTLFLDEIGDLKLETQVKLLRLLQDKSYYPIGSDNLRTTDAVIITATNKDLYQLQKSDLFRADLYYRLKTHEITIPPLKERKDDLPLLVKHFVEKSSKALKRKISKIPAEIETLLNQHDFPGNVRELEGMIYDAVSRSKTSILSLSTIKEKISFKVESHKNQKKISDKNNNSLWFMNEEVLPSFKEVEIALIKEALSRTNSNISQAAVLLGVSRQALNNRISRNNISKN